MTTRPPARPRALLVDYGGVLTSSMASGFADTCEGFGIDSSTFLAEVFGRELATDSPFVQLELGKVSQEEFGALVTPVLNRHADYPVDGVAWYAAMQDVAWALDRATIATIAEVIATGVPTALVSNSWGPAEAYPWDDLPPFEHTVLSCEVGLRKPDPQIFRVAAERVGVPVEECLLVDDLTINVAAATALGMSTIHHSNAADTRRGLADLALLPSIDA